MAPLCRWQPLDIRAADRARKRSIQWVFRPIPIPASVSSFRPSACFRAIPNRPMDPCFPFSLAVGHWRERFELAWDKECDIDPIILRTRLLRLQGRWQQARCLDQELLPYF